MIAKIEYNIIVVRKTLYSVENHTMISSIIFIGIFIILGHMTTPQNLGGIIMLLYVMEFVRIYSFDYGGYDIFHRNIPYSIIPMYKRI